MSLTYTLKHPIKVDGDTVTEVSLRGRVRMEDILASHFAAKDKGAAAARHADMYLTFRMFGLDIIDGEKLDYVDFLVMDEMLGKFMAPPSEETPNGGSGDSAS